LEHHERPDGTGFPRGLFHHQIAPLSALFIIAHDLLGYFLQKGKDTNMEEFIDTRAGLYTQGMFKKIFKAIEKDYMDKMSMGVKT
jgi:hypothetical protein